MEQKNTVISDDLDAGLLALQYDEHAKNLLADKEILAYILKYATEEFRNMLQRNVSKSLLMWKPKSLQSLNTLLKKGWFIIFHE